VIAQETVPQPPPPGSENSAPADPNVEVLTRGPIHEAYAIPVNTGRTAGMVVPKQPPNPVEEIPPEAKPEGDGVLWISGYWSWDDDRKDFVWISGVWRSSPPNYHWIPGYWNQVEGGFQWVSGFWQPVATQEVEYLPQPPDTLEQGPTGPAPAADYSWVPGCWRWAEMRYAWQPGYWTQVNPDWVWTPATYYWCPRGWVYCGGYWDYPLARRGLLFAPVYFAGPVAYYRPAVTVDVGILTFSLFVRPHYCHYYFGDYYAAEYGGMGIYPWFSFGSPRFGYDPLFSYYSWYYRDRYHDAHWAEHLHGWYDYYRGHPDMRPPHTWLAQQRLLEHGPINRPGVTIGLSLGQIRANPHATVRLEVVSAHESQVIRQSIHESREFHAERRQLETTGGRLPVGGPREPERVNLSRLPSYNALQVQQHNQGTTQIEPRNLGTAQGPQKFPSGVNAPGKFTPPQSGTTPSFRPSQPLGGQPSGAYRKPTYPANPPSSGPGTYRPGTQKPQQEKRTDHNTGMVPPGGLPSMASSSTQPRETRRVMMPPAGQTGMPPAGSRQTTPSSPTTPKSAPVTTFHQPANTGPAPGSGNRRDKNDKGG
jgi:hypothetical protein